MAVIVFVLVVVAFEFVANHQLGTVSELKSQTFNLCLDDYHSISRVGAVVDAWNCNGTAAQNWVVSYNSIKHGNNYCLGIVGGNSNRRSKVELEGCNQVVGQVWLKSGKQYVNPNSGLCLSIPGSQSGTQLDIESCSGSSPQGANWSYVVTTSGKTISPSCNNLNGEGQKIACNAALQWDAWHAADSSHNNLLSNYSDGNAYEEWCADFVSYVYQQAGYPFTQGERNGWDEYDANNVQYMGFTMHSSSSGYIPQPGDVAFFDYSDGHVEVVVSGGSHPSFIYGDSGTTDPATGNGDMAANTLTGDGSSGQLLYYLSPN